METPHRSTLRTEGIAKSYGPVVALRSVDIVIEPGEIHALLGANGAGKSTFVKVLSGVIRSDAGSAHVDQQPISFKMPSDAAAAGISTVYQDPALIPDLSIDQNLTISELRRSDVEPWLERLELADMDFGLLARDVPLATLRLIDLARALALDPQLLMLDEITAALTPEQADLVFGVMRQWKTMNRSVLFISHRLGEVLSLCDTATILRNGRDVAHLTLEGVDEAELVSAMLGEQLAGAAPASDHANADLISAVKDPSDLVLRRRT